jgi:hypothetical protein
MGSVGAYEGGASLEGGGPGGGTIFSCFSVGYEVDPLTFSPLREDRLSIQMAYWKLRRLFHLEARNLCNYSSAVFCVILEISDSSDLCGSNEGLISEGFLGLNSSRYEAVRRRGSDIQRG